MNNFTKRLLSGIVYTGVVTAAILLSQRAADILFLVLALMAVREFHMLNGTPVKVMHWSLIATIPLFLTQCTNCPNVWYVLLGIVLFGSFIAELFRKADVPMENWGKNIVPLVMIAIPFALMSKMLRMGDWATQRWVVFATYVFIWANDTGAYCVGSLIGKHKMFPRVSPGKTWEGLVGGFIFSLAASALFATYIQEYAVWQWILIALCCSVFGTIGDLMESLMKRTFGIKDSGKFLPGHGGVLDRFDSILLASTAVWLLLMLFSLADCSQWTQL